MSCGDGTDQTTGNRGGGGGSQVYSKWENDALQYSSIALSAAAVAVSTAYLVVLFRKGTGFPSPLNPSSMGFFLTLSDLSLCVVSIAITTQCTQSFCKIQAAVNQYFILSSFLWTLAISDYSYQSVKSLFFGTNSALNSVGVGGGFSNLSMELPGMARSYGNNNNNRRRSLSGGNILLGDSSRSKDENNMLRYHLLSWLLPLVSVIIMLSTWSNGYTGHACWIITAMDSNSSLLPLWVAVILFWLPLLIVQGFNVYVFRFLVKTLRSMPAAFSHSLLPRFSRRLTIVIGCKMVLIVNLSVLLFLPNHSLFPLSVLEVIGYPLQAFGDFLLLWDSRVGRGGSSNVDSSSMSSSHSVDAESNYRRVTGDEGDVSMHSSSLSLSAHSADLLIGGISKHGEDTIDDESTFNELHATAGKASLTSATQKFTIIGNEDED